MRCTCVTVDFGEVAGASRGDSGAGEWRSAVFIEVQQRKEADARKMLTE